MLILLNTTNIYDISTSKSLTTTLITAKEVAYYI